MTPTSGRAARRAGLGAALALGGALLALGPTEAEAAPVLIRSCTPAYTITEPGRYVLARDLNCPGGGIVVAADNVRLDLGGNTLTGGGAGSGVAALGSEVDPITGLRVENGTVAGFDDGLVLSNAPGARVSRVTATGNVDDGIAVRNSPRARLRGNTATRNGGDGIDVGGCDGCVLAGNRIVGNGDTGIEVESAKGARVAGNTVTGNVDDGIDLQGGEVDDSLVRGNTITGNGDNGIVVDAGSTGNRLAGNRATGNGGPDLEDVNLPANPPSACPNAWRGNRFATDNEAGPAQGPGAGCIR
jgi:parallel beta-helix repeat protein